MDCPVLDVSGLPETGLGRLLKSHPLNVISEAGRMQTGSTLFCYALAWLLLGLNIYKMK
jgi:hypothetical protein